MRAGLLGKLRFVASELGAYLFRKLKVAKADFSIEGKGSTPTNLSWKCVQRRPPPSDGRRSHRWLKPPTVTTYLLPTLFVRRAFMYMSLLVFATTVGAQEPTTGTIEGRVLDSRRGEYLENARITVGISNQEILTDGTGHYRISNVPVGSVTLRIFYTGLGTQNEVVTVAPGKITQHDITMGAGAPGRGTPNAGETIKLDSFVVSSSKEMEGAAIAINEQRFARNIMNVVSADEFGTIGDGSVGEFMKFLPGITSDYTGGDARRFSINGVPAGNVPISFGGFDMASGAGAGTGRQIELDQVSINSVARVEVNRSPTPESPGSALAGSVNFVPRSAFERNKPSYSYNFQYLMRDPERAFGRKTPGPGYGGDKSYRILPGFDLAAIVPVNKNFGFTVSAGYSIQYTPQAYVSPQWRGVSAATTVASNVATGLPDTTPDNPYLTNFSWRDSGKNTTRYAFSTTVDYRLGSHDRISFGFQYGMLKEHFATRVQNFIINRVAPGAWSPTHTTGSNSTFPTTGTAINAGQLELVNSGRIRPGRTIMPTLLWRHDGPTWKMDSGVSYSTSRIQYQDIDKGVFQGSTSRRTNVTIKYDDIFYLRPGTITVTDPNGLPVDPYDLDTYSLVSANSTRQTTYDTKRQAYGNIRRDFIAREIPISLKAGADIRTQTRDRRGVGTETYNYVGNDGRISTTPTTQAGLVNDDSPGPFLDESYSTRIPDFGMPRNQWIDNQELRSSFLANPNQWVNTPAQTAGNYTSATNASNVAEEIITSAYFRGDIAFFQRRLKIVGGLRAEQTNIKTQGPLNDPTLNFQRDAAGNIIFGPNNVPLQRINSTTDPLGAAQLTLIDRGFHFKKEFLRLFPSLNASYNLTENLIVRGAYYQTIGRPDFNQYTSGLTLPNTEVAPNPTNNRIALNNPFIKAWQAESYLVRLEYYFGNVGQISIGGFIRDYENAFGAVTTRATPEFLANYGLDVDTYGEYDVATQFNFADTIRMHGFEFDYKQALTFLPHFARGMQFFANVSSQRGKRGDTFGGFQDMNPFVANWGLSLTRPKFNVRINENYRGIQRRGPITGRGIQPGTYTYRSKRLYVDVSAEYFFRPSMGLFISIRNINNTPEDQKVYGPDTPKYANFRQREDYGSLWTAGIKGRF
jgi:iron complex outermembrane recepter protein